MTQEIKVALTKIRSRTVGGGPAVYEYPLSHALALLKNGTHTYHGSIDDLEKAYQEYLLGDAELNRRMSEVERELVELKAAIQNPPQYPSDNKTTENNNGSKWETPVSLKELVFAVSIPSVLFVLAILASILNKIYGWW
jgi:hypothetical protein